MNFRFARLQTLGAFVSLALLLALVPLVRQADAQQQNEIILSVNYDGLQPNGDAPFAANLDGVHTPGQDENQNNNVVLTNDLIGYRIDWNVNEIDGTAVAITATLPEGMSWVVDPSTSFGAPAGCVDDGTSTIDTNDGRDLVCMLDSEFEGSNGVINPAANVGSQFDATSLTLQAGIGTTEAPPVLSNTVETFASARPKADWVKGKDVLAGDPAVIVSQQPSEEMHGVVDPVSGEVGRIWLYPLRLKPVGGIVGAEKMDDSKDIVFYDHAYEMPDNAALATGFVPATASGAARTACGPYDGISSFAVGSTGTWTCTLDAAATAANGYPVVEITISGHDTSVPPALKGDGSANTSELLVGQIAFFVPEASFVSFPEDIYNGISGTTDQVIAPTDLDPIQVWGSAPTSFDEAGVVNNYAYWNADETPTSGSPGRSFRHVIQYSDGPYQEVSKTTPDGRIYRGADMRTKAKGGLGRVATNTLNATGFGWGHGISGPMSQITPRGNEMVITAELDHTQTAPADPYYYEASALCVAIDNTHQELVALPAQFDVNHLESTSNPYIWGNQDHDSTTQESSNTGPLAQVQVGAHPNFPYHVYSYTHAVETTLVDIPYVVEFGSAVNPVDNSVTMHEVTCNNADVDARGWVDSAADLSVFDPNGDGRYEDITNVRLRVTGPMAWVGTEPNPRGTASSATWGTSVNLNLQVRIKDDPLVNEADMELFAYASRAYTPSPLPHTPEDVVIWDPETMVNPGTPTCTQTTVGIFRDHFGDDFDHNSTVPNGWCNLPFEDDGADSFDLTDNPHDFGGGGENAYEYQGNSTASYTGKYPRAVHADKVTIVEAELSISKVNLAGPNDVNANGDLVEFEVKPGVVGSSLDTLSDITLTDTLPANYEFVQFTQLPTTTTNSNATTPPNNDGTALVAPVCAITGQVISCDFGTQVGGWSDVLRYEVRLIDAGPNATITNTVKLNGNDALSGLAKTQKSASAKSFTGDAFVEAGILKMVDRHVGPCGTYPGAGSAPDDWATDCSVIVADGNIRYSLELANQGFAELDNFRVVDVLPHRDDEAEIASTTLTGDGRTPESDFNGTIELVAASGTGTVLYSMDAATSISRDPDASELANTWCDAPAGGTAVFGAGPCPASNADITAVYVDVGTLPFPGSQFLTIDLATSGNECDDVYTNSFGARTDDILLPIRSNDVTAMVGFCEPGVDIEKDTNGVQADNIDEDTNDNGVLDDGEDTNDVNGVLDFAAPVGSNVGPGVPIGGDITWTYVVTNGDVALINAVVDDSDPAVTPDCDIDGDGAFDGTNIIPVLLPGAEITCQATGIAVAGQYANDSSISGTPVVPTAVDPSIDASNPATWPQGDSNFDPTDESTWPLDPAINMADPTTWPTDPADYGAPTDPVTGGPVFPVTLDDSDPSHYWGLPNDVAVGIEKATNGDDADTTAGPAVPVGGDVTWTYVVTNSGQLPITPATVADSDPALAVVCEPSLGDAGGDAVIDIFLPGESVTCTATGIATAGNYANTATVSGPTSLPAVSCVCDPTDPATWPTDMADLSPNVDPVTGEPIEVEDTDDSHYHGAAPAIDIEKDTNGVQSDDAPGEEIVAGSTVTWTYEVINTGTTAIANATVNDDQGVIVDCDVDGDGVLDGTNVIPFMAVGDSVTCEGTGTAVVGAYTNNATVYGAPMVPDFDTCDCDPEDATTWPTDPADYGELLNPDGTPAAALTAEDPSNYTGITDPGAAIGIEKATNGVDSDEAPGESLIIGSVVTWTYEVANTGTTALTDAAVSDDQGVVVDCDVDGDGVLDGTNVIPLMLPGDSVTCEGTGIAVAGGYTNNASVTGFPAVPDFGTCACDPGDSATWPTDPAAFQPALGEDGLSLAEVAAEDPSNYTGTASGTPAIDIEKATNGADSDEAPGEQIPAGDDVTWTYVVVNSGTTALADATVSDDQGVTVDCDVDGDGVLDGTNVIPLMLPGDSVTCEGTGTAVGGLYTNNATVSGDPIMPDFGTCDCDPSDPATWPTDVVEFSAAIGDDGEPMAAVTDADPSNYTGTQKISGLVWDDKNGDGVFDSDEVTHAGIVVELLDADGNPVLDADGNPITTLTNADGTYEFDVVPGDYKLAFTAPAGVDFTTPGTIDVNVQAGIDVPNLNAGLNAGATTPALAFSGSESTPLATFALVMILAGLALMLISRRRFRSSDNS